jgi:probable phosphoglycerate mutase
MRVFLLRHAEPDYANDTITEQGHRQAQALADALASVRLDWLFASPMGRAQVTAHYIAQRSKIPVKTLDWLRELNSNWEGSKWAWNGIDVAIALLKSGRLPQPQNWHECVPYGSLVSPQAQKLARHFDETLAAFGYLRDGLLYRVMQPNDLTIAFVTHAGTILTLLSHLFNWALPSVYSHLYCDVASITELHWQEHDGYAIPQLLRFNDTSHWRQLLTQEVGR